MDTKLGDKCKISKESKKSQKKRKDDKTCGTVGLTNDDYNLIYNQMEEVSNETCQNIDERNNELVEGLTKLQQDLCVVVK